VEFVRSVVIVVGFGYVGVMGKFDKFVLQKILFILGEFSSNI